MKRTVSLADLATEAGAVLKDRSGNQTSICPLPEHSGDRNNTGAFAIYDHGQKWKCFSACPPGKDQGDVIDFYVAWRGVDKKVAVRELAERAGLLGPGTRKYTSNFMNTNEKQPCNSSFVQNSPPSSKWKDQARRFINWAEEKLAGDEGSGARSYLEQERGLSEATWKAFHVGFCPQNFDLTPERWGLDGKKIFLPRGIVIPGFRNSEPWYIKIRRPLPGQSLVKYIGSWTEKDRLPEVKFGGPRGGRSTMFGLDLASHRSKLVLTEGEWDAMLLWQECRDLCDVGTLGGVQNRFQMADLMTLAAYSSIVVIYDSDRAGDQGREYIRQLSAQIPRISTILPPDHDLTDYWKAGGNLRNWLANVIGIY